MAFASVRRGDWEAREGAIKIRTIKSSNFGHRASCSDCGTPLYVEVDHQPDTTDFSVVTLDDPGVIPPEFHIFWSSKVPWFNPGDDLPRHDKFRPDTRGLESTEPADDSSLSGGRR
jgi:hypothetical protein